MSDQPAELPTPDEDASTPVRRRRTLKADPVLDGALDLARTAAQEAAADFGVGEHLGTSTEGERLTTHYFECTHPGYRGWHWAVTLTRVPRARTATVDEVTLLPGGTALLAPAWVPWSERLQPGDVTPGVLLPTPDNDPRLEPGFTGGELAAGEEPAEWSQRRALVAELGLGRERVLSPYGRDQAAERWLAGPGGPDNLATRMAPATCLSCAYFVRLGGSLGSHFGVCSNEYTPFDATVVSIDHGCGGHSDVVADEREAEFGEPVFDTIDSGFSLFD